MDLSLFEKTVPYASCCLAFTYDSQKIPQPPQSLEALIQSSHKIILQDPCTSITGFGFLVWILMARALVWNQGWKPARFCLKLLGIPLITPALVSILGFITLAGYFFNVYSFTGILLAHLVFL